MVKENEMTLNQLLSDLSEELKINADNAKAYRIFTSVFVAFRDRLPFEKSIIVYCKLPAFLKNIFLTGWRPSNAGIPVKSQQEFNLDVVLSGRKSSNYDFLNEEQIINSVKAVFAILKNFLTPKDLQELQPYLPQDVRLHLG